MKRAAPDPTPPKWWDTKLNASISQEGLDALMAHFKDRRLVVAERSYACRCDFFVPTEAPGYKGKLGTACENCCEKCPRCRNLTTDSSYLGGKCSSKYSGVCYHCATGGNESASGSSDDDEEEEEDNSE